MAVTETDRAYAAGLLDGEGSISILRRKEIDARARPHHQLSVQVFNTDRSMVDWLHDRWPGSLTTFQDCSGKHKRRWGWVVTSSRAEAFLGDVLPYLVVKRERAQLALLFRASFLRQGRNVLPEGVWEDRELIRERVMFLNRKGVV